MAYSTRVIRKVEPSSTHESLALEWAFGLHNDYKANIHNLSTSTTERVVFYTVGHVGVIYDAIQNTQKHLMGHRHMIVASACSRNRRFIVTADSGSTKSSDCQDACGRSASGNHSTAGGAGEKSGVEHYNNESAVIAPEGIYSSNEGRDATMIIWDVQTAIPIRKINTGEYGGVVACAMSLDGMYIATLNRTVPQEIMVWGWTADADTGAEVMRNGADEDPLLHDSMAPEYRHLIAAQDEQISIRFSDDDPHLIVTNGQYRVLFWSWAEGKLKYYSPPIIAKNFKVPIGHFTQTVFVPGTTMACSGTVDGDVLLWEVQQRDRVTKEQDKTMLKMVRVHSSGVSFLTWSNGYIVTGGIDGDVKFLDPRLRLVAWFEDLKGGAITSISFDRPSGTAATAMNELRREFKSITQKKMVQVGTNAVGDFSASDFMVSTSNAMIIDVSANAFHAGVPELLRGRLVVQGQENGVHCIAAHPKLSRLAVAGHSGGLQVWDYLLKRVVMIVVFRGVEINCMAFDPEGVWLAIGCTNGVVKFLDSANLEERKSIKPKRPSSITRMVFASSGRLLATGDDTGCVSLFWYEHIQGNTSKAMGWDVVGRHKTHKGTITGLQFGDDSGLHRLLSVGEDQRLVEYDLIDSEPETGLLVRSAHKIAQSSTPTGFLWMDEDGIISDVSRRPDAAHTITNGLLIANSGYKISAYFSDWSRQCVKTVLAPTFGGPVTEMFTVPTHPGSDKSSLFYATKEKVIGFIQLPLEGDPCLSMGLLAHAGPITSVAKSYDGAYVFTAGGLDQSVMQWRVNGNKIVPEEASKISASVAAEGNGEVPLDHLIAVVEGGREGEFMREIVDYFYYAQIRLQGEETTAKRELLGAVPFSQVPNLFRALGYYPTEMELGRLTYEVANLYGPVEESVDECDVSSIPLKFSQFMRLYVNYRPIFGISRQAIEQAFLVLGADAVTGQISRDVLFKKLTTHGEPLQQTEITAALRSLLGEDVKLDDIQDTITARLFAENLLGFEDYDAMAQGDDGGEEEMSLQ